MKKLLALLLVGMMIFSLAACGDNDTTDPNKDNPGTSQSGDQSGKSNNNDGVENYEQLQFPDGWDNWALGASIDDVWDTSVLPSILPGPIDGMVAKETIYKDNVHSKSDLQVGHLKYAESDDYRYWEVRFEASRAHIDAYLAAMEAKGFIGALDTDKSEDDRYTYCYSHSEGWYVYLHHGGYDDGDLELRSSYLMITDSVHDYVDSVVGIPLPQFGAPYVDYKINSIDIWSNEDDDFIYEDFDVSKDSFPTGLEDSEWFEISFTYYGANIDAAKEYSNMIKGLGWTEESYFSEYSDSSCYVKDGIYLRVLVDDGHEVMVWIGNTDEYYS